MKPKKVYVNSIFPAGTDEIWEKIQQVKTLQYIAYPYATFTALDNTGMMWREGETSMFTFKLFGLVSFGTHTINVITFDKKNLTILTHESNHAVPLWNHTIALKKIGEHSTEYTDKVEIDAGWKTVFVAAWAKLFYKHRQRRWKKLLNQ